MQYEEYKPLQPTDIISLLLANKAFATTFSGKECTVKYECGEKKSIFIVNI
jgi:hypothetical protein